MGQAKKLPSTRKNTARVVTFGVCATGDPRIDQPSRDRAAGIVETIAEVIAEQVRMPDGTAVNVVWSPLLIDGEKQADIVGRQFVEANVDAVVCAPDTWAFPQLTLMSLLAHLPVQTPVNITCGNSAPKPGVVFAHAVNGALAQSGRLTHLNVGSWPETCKPLASLNLRCSKPSGKTTAAPSSRPPKSSRNRENVPEPPSSPSFKDSMPRIF